MFIGCSYCSYQLIFKNFIRGFTWFIGDANYNFDLFPLVLLSLHLFILLTAQYNGIEF